MHYTLLTLPLLSALFNTASALPFSISSIFDSSSNDAAVTTLSSDSVNAQFLRPAQFSRVAYCSSAAVTSWQCGTPCQSLNADVEVLQAGGVGLLMLFDCKDYIAYDPATESVVVAHQGTDPSNFLSDLNDVEVPLVALNSSRFPGVDASVQVHDGFQQTFERTADEVLAGVQAGLSSKGASKVLVTGHSLGAAIAMMDAMMLHQDLDPSVQLTTTVFGLPRGGNPAWADLVDATLGSTMGYMTNQNDPVPTLPPQLLGYRQPSGETHVRAVDASGDATDVVACSGQENENCSDGNSVFDISIANHLGAHYVLCSEKFVLT
ncbi:hypothetical protein H0H92_015749 [Tricholoma furcatifolium]|nr:hypothetical protein H0H92_015749 [Tricholoma furcatifolium]